MFYSVAVIVIGQLIKYDFTLQVQFVLMFIHIVITHAVSECKPTYYLLTNVCFNTVFFMYLFGKFYINSYIKNKSTNNSVKITPSSKHGNEKLSNEKLSNEKSSNEKLSKFISQPRVAG